LVDKDKDIAKYQKAKAKFQEEIEQPQGKLVGKPYFIGAKHIL
jgi:hypothetical protein